jgi:hypothetical protein
MKNVQIYFAEGFGLIGCHLGPYAAAGRIEKDYRAFLYVAAGPGD